MCLAVPMKISRIGEAGRGSAELDGTSYDVDLSLIEEAKVGDYVIVHAGFAIEKLDREDADERLALFAGMAEAYRDTGGEK